MALKSLEKLRSAEYADELLYHDFSIVVDMNRELANEIEAEMDERCVPREKCYYDSLVPLPISDWCMEHNTDFGAYINHFYLPKPLDTDGNPVQKGTRYKATEKILHIQTFINVESMYINVVDDENFSLSMRMWDFERVDCDTQERINDDEALNPKDYCEKYGLKYKGYDEAAAEQYCDLFQRQRKLMGGDAQ